MNIFRWKILSYSFARHHKITTLPNRVIRSRYGGRVIDDARFLGTVRKTSTDATVALLWSQRFQDGAVRRIATVASGEHAGERAFQTLQVFDLAPDIAAMRVGHVGNLAAGVGAPFDHRDQAADLVERETEFAQAQNEAQSCPVCF